MSTSAAILCLAWLSARLCENEEFAYGPVLHSGSPPVLFSTSRDGGILEIQASIPDADDVGLQAAMAWLTVTRSAAVLYESQAVVPPMSCRTVGHGSDLLRVLRTSFGEVAVQSSP